MGKKTWTDEDIKILKKKYGTIKSSELAKILGKTEIAIEHKALRLNLPCATNRIDGIPFKTLCKALGIQPGCLDYWKRNGFKTKKKYFKNRQFSVVDIDYFWKWAEQHQNMINFARFEKYSLGQEPEWVDVKRKADFAKGSPIWSESEKAKLKRLLKTYKYTLEEIAEILDRTPGAVEAMMNFLQISEKPIPHSVKKFWTDKEIELLNQWILSDESIQNFLPERGYKAAVIKMSRLYGTNSKEKVKQILLKKG